MSNTSSVSSPEITEEPSSEELEHSKWEQAPFADKVYRREHLARIDEDIIEHFPTVDDVNEALRAVLTLSQTLKRQQKEEPEAD